MANLTSVDIVNGVPNAGTGTVATINALQADGGMVTIGAKADAKSTATDTTAITAMQVWKQISASVQSLFGAFGTLASPSTSVMSVIPPAITEVSATFKRSSSTTTYIANDLVCLAATGNAGATASFSIPAGRGTMRRVRLRHNGTGSTGFDTSSFRIHWFDANITPTASVGDTDAYSEPIADEIGVTDHAVTRKGAADGQYGEANCDIPFVAGTLYAFVQILTGWTTPTASADFFIDLEYVPG